MQNRRLITIFLIVFIGLLGFSIILPLLPYYAETFGASPTMVGLLTASYAAAQLIGAPVLGRLSDRYGRRPILLLSSLGTLIGFLILGFANSLWLLFAGRILDGLTGGNISVAQAYITDVTDEKDRAKGLGLVGAAFGLGFIIGPLVGGALSTGGRYALPSFVAAGITLVNVLAIYFWLPESLTEQARKRMTQHSRNTINPRDLLEALRRPVFGPLLQARFFYGLAWAIFTGTFGLFAQYSLNLASNETGYVLGYVGLLAVLVQGVAIGRLTARFTERHLIFISVIVAAVGLLGWAFTPNVPILLVVLAPLALASGVLNTVINSAITKVVRLEEVGGALGLASALESLTRVISPIIGGYTLEKLGTWSPGVIAAAVLAWLAIYLWRRLMVRPAAAEVALQ
jgi:DHA1 family tetracycline resistance protein-like MFS transporter